MKVVLFFECFFGLFVLFVVVLFEYFGVIIDFYVFVVLLDDFCGVVEEVVGVNDCDFYGIFVVFVVVGFVGWG